MLRHIFHMKRIAALAALILAAVTFLLAQRQRPESSAGHAPMEMMSIFPTETQPGVYRQVEQSRLDVLAEQGWELVSVMPYVYRNEERNNGDMHGPKPVVTQTYPAHFFKRARTLR